LTSTVEEKWKMTPGMQTKEVRRVKGLTELKTVITRHVAAKPPRKGTTYLDLFALSMERQRLEQELAGIERRRKRVFDRLAEVQTAMEKLVNAAQNTSAEPTRQAACTEQHGERQWKKMPVEY
jgi:hypothetical protein